jgi:hypothetical protein
MTDQIDKTEHSHGVMGLLSQDLTPEEGAAEVLAARLGKPMPSEEWQGEAS